MDGIKVNLPELDLVSKIEAFKTKQLRGKETAPAIRDWVKNALFNLEKVKKALGELPEEERRNLSEVIINEATSSALLQILIWRKPLAQIEENLYKKLAGKEDEEATTREKVAEVIQRVKKTLADLCSPLPFNDSNDLAPNITKAAWLGNFDYQFSYEVSSLAALRNFFTRLTKSSYPYLVENPKGNIRFNGVSYNLTAASLFGEAEKEEVRQMFSRLSAKVFGKEKDALFKKGRELSIEALLEGKAGFCALDIPEEIAVEDGKVFWRSGGPLLLKSNGEKIVLERGLGRIAKKVDEIKSTIIGGEPIYLLVSSLKYHDPPSLNGMPSDTAKKIHVIWHWVSRVLRRDEQLKEFGQASTVTPKKWSLAKEPGITLAALPHRLEINDSEGKPLRISNPFLLMKREMEGKTRKIQVMAVPDHIRGAFGPLVGQEFLEGREPESLKIFLRAFRNEVAKAASNTEKAERI